jgi:hypothetical protein
MQLLLGDKMALGYRFLGPFGSHLDLFAVAMAARSGEADRNRSADG